MRSDLITEAAEYVIVGQKTQRFVELRDSDARVMHARPNVLPAVCDEAAAQRAVRAGVLPGPPHQRLIIDGIFVRVGATYAMLPSPQ